MREYSGMTVNERLYISELIEKFDEAVSNKDINAIILILKEVELNKNSIDDILMSLGLAENDLE